jgi:hypothetical protein
MIVALPEILQNRRWERHNYPFDYVYAQGVFTEEFYRSIETEYNAFLDKGLLNNGGGGDQQFCRNMPGYDAYGMGLSFDNTPGNLGLFVSPQWHDIMNTLFGLKGTGYINAGFHHHSIGSKDGFIHNDFNPVWFPRFAKSVKRIRLCDHNICSYKNGSGPLQDHEKIEVVRSVVMIYYLANPDWFPGDGGETGFYTGPNMRVRDAVKKIPPLNNSLVMYECTPNSYHTFIKNKKSARNSIIMWAHRSMEEAAEKFDINKLERWETAVKNSPNMKMEG